MQRFLRLARPQWQCRLFRALPSSIAARSKGYLVRTAFFANVGVGTAGLLSYSKSLSETRCEVDTAKASDLPASIATLPKPRSRNGLTSWLRIFFRDFFRLIRVSTRLFELSLRATPLALSLPFCWICWNRGGEEFFWRLLLSALQAEGPIAIKFAQWASTRPDLLPRTVCNHFAVLQEEVRPHSFKATKRILTETFGEGWEKNLTLDPKPLGSGCMAQVYRGEMRGTLRVPDSGEQADVIPKNKHVAIKVRHPGAQEKVDLDLEVMYTVVGFIEAIWPAARYLGMSEAVCHFEAFVRPQANLGIEAANLDVFNQRFRYRHTGKGIRAVFPEVIWPYASEAVLVESFEEGTPLQSLLGQAPRYNSSLNSESNKPMTELQAKVGDICMTAFLQMLFADNFIHGDLHPGNIYFRESSIGGRLPELHVVLLDAGLAVTLEQRDRQNFLELFNALATNNGNLAAKLMVERSPGDRQYVKDEDVFIASVSQLVTDAWGSGIALGKVKMGDLFGRMLSLACEHRVKLETCFVTVATSLMIAEGVGRQLDPLTDVAAAARPLLADAVARKIWNFGN